CHNLSGAVSVAGIGSGSRVKGRDRIERSTSGCLLPEMSHGSPKEKHSSGTCVSLEPNRAPSPQERFDFPEYSPAWTCALLRAEQQNAPALITYDSNLLPPPVSVAPIARTGLSFRRIFPQLYFCATSPAPSR